MPERDDDDYDAEAAERARVQRHLDDAARELSSQDHWRSVSGTGMGRTCMMLIFVALSIAAVGMGLLWIGCQNLRI